MIKFSATALIHHISPVIDIPSRNGGQSFQKRELILDDTWTKDGNTYPNFVLIEFSGDKMAQLDSFAPGQRVTVEAYVNGREYQGRYFNTIKGMSVAPYQQQQTSHPVGQRPAPAPGYPQQPQYPQQPASYPNQGGYPQAPAPAPMPGTPQGGNLGPEGLPFRN
ncbi:DUF3127 domain-containing protein [Xylanibacter rodentium]|uniref:DUF3127 domain-containing protein n=1 Tax=Xylanibacter rodentium TaxID=2736289 RepID=UPI002575CFD2|nr:DUF3127 domain-containing protein [Xylanibacter rodentium]